MNYDKLTTVAYNHVRHGFHFGHHRTPGCTLSGDNLTTIGRQMVIIGVQSCTLSGDNLTTIGR